MTEEQVIEKIETCGISKIQFAFKNFRLANDVLESDEEITNLYCKSLKTKKKIHCSTCFNIGR